MTLPDPALPKSWSLTSMVPCVSIVPSRKKSPSNSFFLVSMLSTGRPALRYFFLRRAMFSNWALRFGSRGPIVFFFNAFRRRYRCLRSSCETTCRLAGVPNSPSLSAICRRDRFVHFTSARIGSPAVWSWRTFRKFSSRAGEASINRLRPPPFFLHWQTWGETAFFELTEIPGGVTSEASLLAAAFPALVQVGTQPLPIIYIPCPQFEPFLWTQPRGQARHHAHRPLHHQTRRRLFASTGTPL